MIINKVSHQEIGVTYFKNVFLLNPSILNHYFEIVDRDGKVLSAEIFINNHSEELIGKVSESIDLLGQPEKLRNFFRELGATHYLNKIPEEGFTLFGNALNATVNGILDQDCTIEILNYISLFYNEGSNLMIEGSKTANESGISYPDNIPKQMYVHVNKFEYNNSNLDNRGYQLSVLYMNEVHSGSYIYKYEDSFANLGILTKLLYSQKFDYIYFVLTRPNYSINDQTPVIYSGYLKINQQINERFEAYIPIMNYSNIIGYLSISYELKYEEESIDLTNDRISKESLLSLNLEKRLKIKRFLMTILQYNQIGQLLINNIYKLGNKMEELFKPDYIDRVIKILNEFVGFIDQPEKLKKVLKLLGARFEQLGINVEKIPLFGNALNATLLGHKAEHCSIEIINLLGLVFNEATDYLVEGYLYPRIRDDKTELINASVNKIVNNNIENSFHKRELNEPGVALSSEKGKALFKDSLAEGNAEIFFSLIESYNTQSDPAYCGLASLSIAMNALLIDPHQIWQGVWRWFSEEQLYCCEPLEKVKLKGITLEKLHCLSKCKGALSTLIYGPDVSLDSFRALVRESSSTQSGVKSIVIASYSRKSLNQTGSGHFSPLGAYNAKYDMVLILDTARFKLPPHWVPLDLLYEAMLEIDPETNKTRGFMIIRKPTLP